MGRRNSNLHSRRGWRRMVRGMGGHPGMPVLVLLILLGAVAGEQGVERGWYVGALVMAIVFGPIYLWSSYERGDLPDDQL